MWLTRRRFHLIRMLAWTANLPLALLTSLKTSITYLVFISVAALVESSATDWDQARQAEKKARAECPTPEPPS